MRLLAWICCTLLLALSALTIQAGRRFYNNLTVDAPSLIASDLNEHSKTDAVVRNQGRLVDRDGLAWPVDPGSALDNLAWAGDDALILLESMYNVLYDETTGVSTIDRSMLLPKIDPLLGVSGLYERKGYDINVSVSSSLSALLYESLKDTGASRAASIVSDYSTGEILAYVSMPSGGDAADLITEETFMPGALMNIPTALAVYRNLGVFDVNAYTDIQYVCTGELRYSDTKVVTCPYAHGQLSIADGFAANCNCMFASLASELGTTDLQNASEDLGLNKTLQYMNSRVINVSRYTPAINRTEFGLGWSGAGQNEDGWDTAINIYQLALMINSIANGSAMPEGSGSDSDANDFMVRQLHAILGLMDRETGEYEQLSKPENIPKGVFNMTPDEARYLRSLMEQAAGFESVDMSQNIMPGDTSTAEGAQESESAIADAPAPVKTVAAQRFGTRARQLGYTAGAKTGAAQVSDTVPLANGEQTATINYAISWFAGYVKEETISIIIVAERPTVGTAQDVAVKILPLALDTAYYQE
ncbi:MAG: hypothetical protein LBL96_03505 [Clostridiales bacterium]|jgi:peptidoglycan glycosyltransferase|nr:hypothetical protein [Clostridiales bacterium]